VDWPSATDTGAPTLAVAGNSKAAPSRPQSSMRRASIWILLGGLAALLGFSVYLAATRIYQVDECNEVIAARILATGQASTHPGVIGLLQFPLSWAIHGATRDRLGTPFATRMRYGNTIGPRARFIPTGWERCGGFWNN